MRFFPLLLALAAGNPLEILPIFQAHLATHPTHPNQYRVLRIKHRTSSTRNAPANLTLRKTRYKLRYRTLPNGQKVLLSYTQVGNPTLEKRPSYTHYRQPVVLSQPISPHLSPPNPLRQQTLEGLPPQQQTLPAGQQTLEALPAGQQTYERLPPQQQTTPASSARSTESSVLVDTSQSGQDSIQETASPKDATIEADGDFDVADNEKDEGRDEAAAEKYEDDDDDEEDDAPNETSE